MPLRRARPAVQAEGLRAALLRGPTKQTLLQPALPKPGRDQALARFAGETKSETSLSVKGGKPKAGEDPLVRKGG